MKTTFTASQFTPTEWDTAEDKAKFANHFVRFVESGFKESLFYDWFYKRLSMTFGHIAEYNRNGFYHVWFSDTRKKLRFLERSVDTRRVGFGSPQYTYSDVEKELGDWVRRKKLVDYWTGFLASETEAAERAELARLTYKYETIRREQNGEKA